MVKGHAPALRETPRAGSGTGDVKMTGCGQSGEVVQKHIFGTIARRRAKSTAGRASESAAI